MSSRLSRYLFAVIGASGIAFAMRSSDPERGPIGADGTAIATEDPAVLPSYSLSSDRPCVRLALLSESTAGRAPALRVRARNDCETGVALLTSPVETRVRTSTSQPLREDGPNIAENVFARLLVVSSQFSEKLEYSGHRRATVYGLPEVTTLESDSALDLELADSSRVLSSLPPGKYRAWFLTVAARMAVPPNAAAKVIRVGFSLADHNAQSSGAPRVFLRPGLMVPTCASVEFEVYDR